jgi:hypothetical protein
LRENREVFPETDPDEQLRQHIADLEARLQSLQSRLPAHSIPPSMLAELDELDGQLGEARHLLAQKGKVAGGSP